jgi:hypothetical protein
LAREVPGKSVELEHRIGRLELAVRELQSTLQAVHNRVMALQAHVDHWDAKRRGV